MDAGANGIAHASVLHRADHLAQPATSALFVIYYQYLFQNRFLL
jgi:hypothetical protein